MEKMKNPRKTNYFFLHERRTSFHEKFKWIFLLKASCSTFHQTLMRFAEGLFLSFPFQPQKNASTGKQQAQLIIIYAQAKTSHRWFIFALLFTFGVSNMPEITRFWAVNISARKNCFRSLVRRWKKKIFFHLSAARFQVSWEFCFFFFKQTLNTLFPLSFFREIKFLSPIRLRVSPS